MGELLDMVESVLRLSVGLGAVAERGCRGCKAAEGERLVAASTATISKPQQGYEYEIINDAKKYEDLDSGFPKRIPPE